VIAGINYPWTVFEGRPNYGCDFGRNRWNGHAGVTMHLSEVRADFTAMAAAGVEVARWFVFTDGRGAVEWSADGTLAGFADRFHDDMTAALDIAGASGVRLCLVLVDFAWLDDPLRRAVLIGDAPVFLARVLDPFLDRYGRHPAIHSFDVINEPDWVTGGLATDQRRIAWTLAELRAFVGAASKRIHRNSDALVTLGGAQVRFAKEWDDDAYGLDFVQIHSYPEVRYPSRDELLFWRTAASFELSKPLLIGECPSNPRVHPAEHLSPAYTFDDYVTLARDGGYMGVWPWSFKGVDGFGAMSFQRQV
jgi:hypothetical protein